MADFRAIALQRGITNNIAPGQASGTQVLAANTSRVAWQLQNLGTNPLYVSLGPNVSTTGFHFILKGGTTQDDGNGGSFSQSAGVVYTGIISATSANPVITRYVILEI